MHDTVANFPTLKIFSWFSYECFSFQLSLFLYPLLCQFPNDVSEVKSDHRSKFSNLSNWKWEAWKKSGLQRDSNPWPPRYRCDHWMKSWIWLYLARRQMLDKSDITFVGRQKRLKLRQICHHICPRQMYNKCWL